ncbi:MAG: tetratricopeptide repeat protein [Rhodoferax sp.]|nr:tetratricopeptide repeat protein [Rhodoferax sp.]
MHEAETSYRRALQIRPDLAEVHFNLGNALQAQRELPASVLAYRQALHLKPDFPDAHYNLANSLKDLGRMDDAEASYYNALRLDPGFSAPLRNLLFTLNYHPDKSAEEVFAAYRSYEQQFASPSGQAGVPTKTTAALAAGCASATSPRPCASTPRATFWSPCWPSTTTARWRSTPTPNWREKTPLQPATRAMLTTGCPPVA